jgi:hypothetical protein
MGLLGIKLLEYKKLTIYRNILWFQKQESVEIKIGCSRKCTLSSFKARTDLKQIVSQNKVCQKVFDKGESPPQSQNIHI